MNKISVNRKQLIFESSDKCDINTKSIWADFFIKKISSNT